MGEVGRCLRKCHGPESEVARRERVLIGEVFDEFRPMGAGKKPWPAGPQAVGRIAEAMCFVVVDPENDIVVDLGGARECTRGEGSSHGGGECRTGYGMQLLVSSPSSRDQLLRGRNLVVNLFCMGNRGWARGPYRI